MAEISRAFPSAPVSSKQSPARDPRRMSRQENGVPIVSPIANIPTAAAPPAKPKSYGEKLVESLVNLSSETSTAITLKNEYAKAKKAQTTINQHYEKLRNLSQFPAARDLVGRIRESQNKDVENLKEQLSLRGQNQKNLTKRTAALVDAEAKSQSTPSAVLEEVQAESRSTKQSVTNLRQEVSDLNIEFKERWAAVDRDSAGLRRTSNSDSGLLQTIKRRQDKDFDSMKKIEGEVTQLFSSVRLLNDRIKSLSGERSPVKHQDSPRPSVDRQKIPIGVDEKKLSTLEDRVKNLESLKNRTHNAATDHSLLENRVSQIDTRLQAVERASQSVSGTNVQSYSLTSTLEARMAKAEENIGAIREIMEYKDQILCDDIEAKQKQMAQQLDETVDKIKAEAALGLERAISEVKASAPIKSEAVSSQEDTIQLFSDQLETLTTSCRSLESRYASITAEALAHQAIPIIESRLPDPQLLHGVIGRFNVIEMHLAQILRLRDLPQVIDSHSQRLDSLQAQVVQGRTATGDSDTSTINNSTVLAEVQKNLQDVVQKYSEMQEKYAEVKEIDAKLSSYNADNQQKHDQVRQELDELNKEKDRVTGELTSISGSIDELKAQVRALEEERTALTESTSSQVQNAEQRLTTHMTETEGSIQQLEQRVLEMLGASGLQDAKASIENFEAALQQHVDHLTYQLTQLEDQQKATNLEISGLQRVDDEGIKTTLEELAYRIDDLVDGKEFVGRRTFRDSLSPRSDRSGSPSQSSHWSGDPARDDDKENNARAFSYNGRVSLGKKKSKRKFSRLSGASTGPSISTFRNTPPRGPASMMERTGPPASQKRQRILADLVDRAAD